MRGERGELREGLETGCEAEVRAWDRSQVR